MVDESFKNFVTNDPGLVVDLRLKRQIIQIITDASAETWWALCNDGTIWWYDSKNDRWVHSDLPSIPQEIV